MLITAYLDESGLGHAEKLCIAAGFMGNDSQWAAFAADWLQAIKPRKSLHVKELRFTGNKAHRARSVLAKTGPIPYRYNLESIACGAWHSDINAVLLANGRESVFDSPYMMAMNTAIHTALRLLSPDDQILFVCERQDRYRLAMEFLKQEVFKKRDIDPRVVDIIFVPKGQTCCTEAGDFLAFMSRENLVNGENEIVTMGKSIFGATGVVNGHIWTRDELDRLVKEWDTVGLSIPRDFMKS